MKSSHSNQFRAMGLALAAGMAVGAAGAQTMADGYQAQDGPNAAAIRWLDFVGLNTAEVYGAGQDFVFTLQPVAGVGTRLSATLSEPGLVYTQAGNLSPRAVPSYVGAAHRGAAFGLALRFQPDVATRQPALRVARGTLALNFANLLVKNEAGDALQFKLVAVDAEETVPRSATESETLRFTTDGGPWSDPVILSPVNGAKPYTTRSSFPVSPERLNIDSILSDAGGAPLADADYAAAAFMLTSTNPTAIRMVLSADLPYGTSSEAQAAAIGIVPLIPEANLNCASPVASQAICTLTVQNPPQSPYSIPVQLGGDVAAFETDCASLNLAALATAATCTVKAAANTSAVNPTLTLQPLVNAAAPSFLVTSAPQTVSLGTTTAPSSVTPVPSLSAWGLLALGLGLGVLGVFRRKSAP